MANLRQSKYADLLPAYNNISYLEGPARLAEGGVAVNDALVQAERLIIATGARPAVPRIAGIEDVQYLTSTSALALEALPKSMLVIGGGYIGAELAQMFARMGVKVTIVCRSRLLPAAEPEVADGLSGYLRDEGIELHCGVAYQRIEQTSTGIALVVVKDKREEILTAERLLVATGRTPNIEGLGLSEAGVEQAANGSIRVDDRMRRPRVAAFTPPATSLGATNSFTWPPMAQRSQRKNALNGDSLRYDHAAMPAIVFTDPQVASVGLTEAQARAAGYQVLTSVLPLSAVPRALAARDTRGLIKLVARCKDPQTSRRTYPRAGGR